MHDTRKTKALPAERSGWPDLLHKYSKLAIPAVVAAVTPDSRALQRRSTPAGTTGAPEPRKERR